MPCIGDLFVEKHDNSILGHPFEQLGSRGCTYSVALQYHPEPLKRPVPLSHQFGGTIIVYLALNLDFSREEVGQASLTLSRISVGLISASATSMILESEGLSS